MLRAGPEALPQNLHAIQLALERYEIAFRQDLAMLADEVARLVRLTDGWQEVLARLGPGRFLYADRA